MAKLLLGLICVIALRADYDVSFRPGQLWKITYQPQSRQYEYEVLDRPPHYVYICVSSKELHLGEHDYVMFAVEGKSLYLIDLDGNGKQTTLLRKEALQPVPPPVF